MCYCVLCNRAIVGRVQTAVEEGLLLHRHCLLHFKDKHGFLWLQAFRTLLLERGL